MEIAKEKCFFSQIIKKVEEEIKNLKTQSTEKIKQIDSKKLEEIKKINEQHHTEKKTTIEYLEKKLKNSFSMEKRRIRLVQENLLEQKVLNRVLSIMEECLSNPKYEQILVDWICKGALAVINESDDSVFVQTNEKEISFYSQEFLEIVYKKFLVVSKRKDPISFLLDKDNLISEQGVVLISKDRRLLFSNSISSQIARYSTEIRSYVFEIIGKTFT